MRMRRLLAVPAVAILFLAACGDDDDDSGGQAEETGDGGGEASGENTGEVNVLNAMEPEEAEAVQGIVDELINSDADYEATMEASGNFEEDFQIRSEGGDLDIALLPQPGAVADAVGQGAVSLEDLGFDIAELEDTFGEYLISLGEVDGEHYGLPTNVNLKSMIWYPVDDFDAAGYEVPTTFDDLIALSDQIRDEQGVAPWCVGFESEGATGWPATDWMEDIMLRTAGPDVYDQWVSHDIPFNDESVQNAAEIFGEVMFGDGYVLGGADQTPAIAFGDAPGPMFQDPPGCWLHRQASFINAFFPEDAAAGEDYDWFPFPPIDQEGTLIAGEFAVAFRNAPEIADFLERFGSEEVQCAQGGETASSRLSPNIGVGPDCYANEILAASSEVTTAAIADGSARFDASDQMPTEVGAGSFWTGMMDYMSRGPDSASAVLDDIEASWPQ
ncbi:MAG TPA: ABC transporter substrate-binding protein [Acidimicrobiales bacterium]|nr:ABC transporter substrate-binding protein [Acidimicrobiales bacterium]